MQNASGQPSRVEVVLQTPQSPNATGSTETLTLVAWPIAAVLIVLLLRRAIAEALKAFGTRATKLSVGVVAVELAAASARSWGGAPLDELRDTAVTAPVSDSTRGLLASLADEHRADYAVVDLGNGREWLTSRLYLVASLIARMRGLQAVVFVASAGVRSTLVGVVGVDKLRWGLAAHFPWLELALSEALTNAYTGSAARNVTAQMASFALDGRLEGWRAGNVLQNFKEALQHRDQTPPVGDGWERLGDGLWERAEWVTPESLRLLLGPALAQSAVVQDLDSTEEQFAKRVLRAMQDWVPVVDDQRTFHRLINRGGFINRSARLLADGA